MSLFIRAVYDIRHSRSQYVSVLFTQAGMPVVPVAFLALRVDNILKADNSVTGNRLGKLSSSLSRRKWGSSGLNAFIGVTKDWLIMFASCSGV